MRLGALVHVDRDGRDVARRFTPTTLVLVAALMYVFVSCGRRAQPTPNPMIVVGVDGADWAVIEELWRQNRLPVLRGLARDGTRAVLKTSWSSSPVIWSTVATGVLPSVHGIDGFVDATEQGDVPVSSASRRVPALWNMLTSLRRRTMVVGWWATWPAESIDGVIVSDRILESIDGTFSPPSFAAEVERGLAESAAPAPPFLDIDAGEDRDRAMAWFAERLAWDDFDLLLAYFRVTDLASHYYWRWFASDEPAPGVSAEHAPEMRERLFRAYEAVDVAIGEIVATAREPVNVIVLSDHGFRSARRELVRVSFDLDRALERLGYLARQSGGGVDVARSRLYTFASGRTQANKMVRFGNAVATAQTDRDELRAALGSDLARITWSSGAPALTLAEPPLRQARRGADLLVQVQADEAALPLLLDGQPFEGVVADVHRISGGHGAGTDGVLIAAGPDIAAGAVLDGIHVRDMAPTFLYGLGAPVARDFAGRPWRELFTEEYRERHPVREIESWGTREHSVAPSAADEKLLEELRALGYLD
jgi:predicted AlkP superfamily phosphohydrolase/phosphomutase